MSSDVSVAQLAIVGAGPAGLSAAVSAGLAGVRSVLIDAGARPGGQFWRHSPDAKTGDPKLTDLLQTFESLVAGEVVTYLSGKQVWLIQNPATGGFILQLNNSGTVAEPAPHRVIRAERLLLCPGGYDRQLPVPGWQLPGVMAAGGLQAMLKEHQVRPGTRILLGGTGPFLLPVATALAAAGASVVGICEANTVAGWWRGCREVLSAREILAGKVIEAGGYLAKLAKYRIPYYQGAVITRITGDTHATTATIGRPDGSTIRTVEIDTVGMGWGFTPSMELVLAVGARTRVDVDGSLVAVVNGRQASTVPGVWVAGEATGVGGADKACCEGQLAGLAVAVDLGIKVDAALAVRLQRKIRSWRGFGAALHRAYPVPSNWKDRLTPQTVICRCEEVTYSAVQDAQGELGADSPRLIKLVTRAGMGWCQGRLCGFAVAGLCGNSSVVDHADLAAMSARPLAFPVTLGEIADSSE